MRADIDGLNSQQRETIVKKVEQEIVRAGGLLDLSIPAIPIKFDLSGSAAGMYCRRGSARWFRFNPVVFSLDFAAHVDDTVIHEVCHYAIDMAYWRAKPHGPEWRQLMRVMGGEPSATYRTNPELESQIPVRRQRRHLYWCGCREHEISTTRHNRVVKRRATYCCSYCHQALRYNGPAGSVGTALQKPCT